MLILKQLQEIHHLLAKHFDQQALEASHSAKPHTPIDDLIDEYDVRAILNISRSTMFRLKSKEQLYLIKIGHKSYFLKSQIEALRNRYLK